MVSTAVRRLIAACAVFQIAPLAAQGIHAPPLTVHAIWGSPEFVSDLVEIAWTSDGKAYTAIEENASGNTDLYRVDALTGTKALVVRGADLVSPGAVKPVAIEQYQFSGDGSKLLIFTNSARVWRENTKGTFFVWDLTARRLTPVSTRPGYQQFAKFSPEGRRVAFVRENNIYVTDLATGDETAVTRDGGENVINGTSDWVYEEELNLRDAFRWSPDGRRIAFWRLDQTAIRPFYLLNQDSLYPSLVPVRYPKTGTPNSDVKIGVVEVSTGRTSWIELGPDKDIYVAAMDFADAPDQLWLTRLNRHQNRLDLLMADATSGAARVIMTDADSAWVDANQPRWIDGGKQFLFVSERDGNDQVYLFDRGGSLVRRVTPGGWDVQDVYGVDEKSRVLYFSGAIEGPLGRQLLRVGLDGKGLARISTDPGTHSAAFAPTFALYVETYSQAGVPPVQTLRRSDGTLVRTIASNAKLREKVSGLGLNRPEFIAVKTPEGVLLVARDAGTGGLPRRERGQPRDRRARREVHETDLPPPRPLRIDRPDRGRALVRRAAVRESRSHRHLGLELRRLHDISQHVPRRGRVQGGARRGAGDGLAFLRYDLHRALYAHAAGERSRLRRECPVDVWR